jgi:ankyrin repeat protein
MARTESDDLSVTSSLTTALSVDDDGLVVTDESENQEWDAGSPENVLLTNFWKACANGPLERVEAILKEWHINVNSANRTGFTALHQAAHAGHADIVEFLIKNAGANTLAVGGMGWMPLHLAASAGHEEVVQVLLKSMRKFKYSTPDKLGCTPMMIAMRENHQGVVEILKAAGARK